MKSNLNNDTNFIKIIALIAMIIDHIGLLFYPNIYIFRIIGRISYPLFSYSLMVGYFKTSNYKKYLARVFILALICQPVYYLLVKNIFQLNIMFTLVMQLIILYALDKKKYNILYILIITLFIDFNYNLVYIFLTLIMYYARNNKLLFTILFISLYSFYLIGLDEYFMISFFSVLSLPLILTNTNFNLKLPKHFFYYIYPIHIIILYIIYILV